MSEFYMLICVNEDKYSKSDLPEIDSSASDLIQVFNSFKEASEYYKHLNDDEYEDCHWEIWKISERLKFDFPKEVKKTWIPVEPKQGKKRRLI